MKNIFLIALLLCAVTVQAQLRNGIPKSHGVGNNLTVNTRFDVNGDAAVTGQIYEKGNANWTLMPDGSGTFTSVTAATINATDAHFGGFINIVGSGSSFISSGYLQSVYLGGKSLNVGVYSVTNVAAVNIDNTYPSINFINCSATNTTVYLSSPVLDTNGNTMVVIVSRTDTNNADTLTVDDGMGTKFPVPPLSSKIFSADGGTWHVISDSQSKFTISTNAPAFNTWVTNANSRSSVSASILLTSGTSDTAKVTLIVEQGSGITNKLSVSKASGTTTSDLRELMSRVQPNGRFMFTNECTGTATAAFNANSYGKFDE